MRRVRVIPVLTVIGRKLVKTVRFKKPNYLGDPINAIKIFNDKEVDEIIVLDIGLSKKINKVIQFDLIEEMGSECFMPLAYGGGIKHFDDAKRVFELGVEKVILNSCLSENCALITKIAETYGSQSVVVSIDVRKTLFNKRKLAFESGKRTIKTDITKFIEAIEAHGAGEILIQSIDKDGTFQGYDLELCKKVAEGTSLPVIACGGASSIDDFLESIRYSGCSAVAAASLFGYSNLDTRSILINYPSQDDLTNKLFSKFQK